MTFSVVGCDPVSGELGVAVASGVFAVGRAVPWIRPGVGAVATQSRIRRGYGPHALAGVEAGVAPRVVLDTLLRRDADAYHRQVAVVCADGSVAAHTGGGCVAVAGHRTGAGWSAQGNTLVGERVLDEMATAFLTASGPLAERLLTALDAGEAAGGDVRGRQSAALLLAGAERLSEPWDGVTIDLRVDDSASPLVELRRLLDLQRAYEAGDAGALSGLVPHGPREVYQALDAARRGDLDAARRAIAELRRRPGWDEWLRSNASARRLPHLADLLD